MSPPVTVDSPALRVHYQGRDVSADITAALVELNYCDFLEGQSDTLELVLEDVQRRWQNSWYPQHGDRLSAQIGYAHAALLPCGDFDIDEVELDGPPDVVRIKALAAGTGRSVRTPAAFSYEDTTLEGIARAVARRHQLRLRGQIAHVPIGYVAQPLETDLAFLRRLFADYGYAVSVRGRDLCVFGHATLKQAPSLLVLHREEVSRYRFSDRVREIYQQAQNNYHDPRSRQLHSATAQDSQRGDGRHSADTLRLNARAENRQQARLKADAALERANDEQTTASLTLAGNVRLMAGVNLQLADFGRMDGHYAITQARHQFSRSSGYRSDIELKRVRPPSGTPRSTA